MEISLLSILILAFGVFVLVALAVAVYFALSKKGNQRD